MSDSMLKFIIDLGSIGAICVVCYFFCNCMYKMVVKFIEYISNLNQQNNEEHKLYMETIKDLTKITKE